MIQHERIGDFHISWFQKLVHVEKKTNKKSILRITSQSNKHIPCFKHCGWIVLHEIFWCHIRPPKSTERPQCTEDRIYIIWSGGMKHKSNAVEGNAKEITNQNPLKSENQQKSILLNFLEIAASKTFRKIKRHILFNNNHDHKNS